MIFIKEVLYRNGLIHFLFFNGLNRKGVLRKEIVHYSQQPDFEFLFRIDVFLEVDINELSSTKKQKRK